MQHRLVQLLCLLLVGTSIFAQEPQKVYSFIKKDYPKGFYEEQVKAWNNVITKEPNNASAWYNYYQANRYVQREKESHQKRQERLDKVVAQMAENVPNSYEYHLAAYRNENNPMGDDVDHLLTAYNKNPARHEVYEPLLTHYLINGEENKFRQFTQKLYNSGEPSPGLLHYGYNMIAGLEENAILLTNGDNDTYPAWLMQVGEGVRPDVRVLNVHLLRIQSYRDRVLQELGLEWDIDLSESREAMEDFEKQLIPKLASNPKGYPVYSAITLGKNFTQPLENHLYLTGLAFRYSTESLDNIARLKRNFEKRYALDYLQTRFGYDMSSGIVQRMNQNYIVPLLNLYDHYHLAGDTEGMERMKNLALAVAKGSREEEKVKGYFRK